MTPSQELREHALYNDKCHIGFLSAKYPALLSEDNAGRPPSFEIPEVLRRMFLLFVAEALENPC